MRHLISFNLTLILRLILAYLERVCKWIHAYLDRQLKGEGAALFKLRAHSAFYAACHIPFYIVAARHHDFMDNRKGNRVDCPKKRIITKIPFVVLTSLQSFDLPRIVNSPLNPLRYCHPTCVRQFAESASHLQVRIHYRISLPMATLLMSLILDCILSHNHDTKPEALLT